MIKIAQLHEEQNRFFLSYKAWLIPVVAFIGSLWVTGFGVFFAYNEYMGETHFGWNIYIFCGIFIVCGVLLLSSVIFGANGKGAKEFKGYLLWGAGVDGLFMLSPEVRPTRYDWSRVTKIIVVEKVIFPDEPPRVMDGIYGLSELGCVSTGNRATSSHVVIFYVDQMNTSETKIGKMAHDPAITKANALVKSYKPLETARVMHLLSKYAPKEIVVERKTELNLTKKSV